MEPFLAPGVPPEEEIRKPGAHIKKKPYKKTLTREKHTIWEQYQTPKTWGKGAQPRAPAYRGETPKPGEKMGPRFLNRGGGPNIGSSTRVSGDPQKTGGKGKPRGKPPTKTPNAALK